eukprot:TRINITY_DN5091_c0_g1_i1.p1 TRINITY_DN5091_c0_g1~~TRINITY_DN5091_c0_g1_i1.p1  ORF type:complete len:277 (-),score=31.52 TRINITY_DN5091_c0_g1_i1:54-884(-)
MSNDIIQQVLALLDACIAATGPDETRILPGRSFANIDLRNKIGYFLRDEGYVFVSRKGADVKPQFKNLAGLKKVIETKYQTQRTIPILKLVNDSTKQERSRKSQSTPNGDKRRGRPPKKKGWGLEAYNRARKADKTSARPSTKFTSASLLSPSSKTVVYTSDTEHASTRSLTLIKQNYGPTNNGNIDDRYYMGVVKFFGVNLPIPVGTMVWPVEIKMELDKNNNNDNDNNQNGDSASYHSESDSNVSSDFESVPDEFSEDLNAMPEDEELLSNGLM